jgi:hypothetical protein
LRFSSPSTAFVADFFSHNQLVVDCNLRVINQSMTRDGTDPSFDDMKKKTLQKSDSRPKWIVKVSLSNHFAPPLGFDTQINVEELDGSSSPVLGIFTIRLCAGCNLILLLCALFYQQIDKQRRLFACYRFSSLLAISQERRRRAEGDECASQATLKPFPRRLPLTRLVSLLLPRNLVSFYLNLQIKID